MSEACSDVCIVGAGPAGLAAGITLARSGRRVAVLDQAVPPIDKACGEGLLPAGVAALERLGVSLEGLGWPLHGISFINPQGSALNAPFPGRNGLGVRRPLLHQALIDCAESCGVKMLWGLKNVHTQPGQITFEGGMVRTRLIVGADGHRSMVRREAGLAEAALERKRFGFRRHYRVSPWSHQVEVHWAHGFQVYVTPTSARQVGVALLSHDPHLRIDTAMRQVPALAKRLAGAEEDTRERGSLTLSRKLRRVYNAGYVLLGDAGGSVDAITGEGLSLAFQQSEALLSALDAGDLAHYQRAHRRLAGKPLFMAAVLQAMACKPFWQRKALGALAWNPTVFRLLLAAHVGR